MLFKGFGRWAAFAVVLNFAFLVGLFWAALALLRAYGVL